MPDQPARRPRVRPGGLDATKVMHVARREFVTRVMTRSFVIGAVIVPALLVMAIQFATGLAGRAGGARPPEVLLLMDATGELGAGLAEAVDEHNRQHPQQQYRLQTAEEILAAGDEALERRLLQQRPAAAIVVGGSPVTDGAAVTLYVTRAGDFSLVERLRWMINDIVRRQRYQAEQVDPALIAELQRPVPLEVISLAGDSARRIDDPIQAMMVPFFFLFLMFMAINATSQSMLTSVLEEKSSRVVEVLLAALSPLELMAGKILGLVGVGLVMIVLWSTAAGVAAAYRGLSVPLTGGMIALYLAYYLLGFLLLSAILAAAGAMCSTLKEAQQLAAPVTMLMVVPLLLWVPIAQNPDGTLAVALSFVPPLTPQVMVLRMAATPLLPAWQIAATLLLLAACVPLTIAAAARVFRTGILMHGKRPTPRELLRWLNTR